MAAPIVVRQRSHRWDDRALPKYFVDGDVLMSHLAAVCSSLFPAGEAFFVRSVRHFRSAITDPELLGRVNAFIAQESVHVREHHSLNHHLAALGYPVTHLDRRARLGLGIAQRVLPPVAQLAVTATLEHVTATLADEILGSDDVQQLFTDDEIRRLVTWHALEEAEHRAVAFDVFQHVCDREWLRTWTFRVVMCVSTLDVATALLTSLASDPHGRRPSTLRKSWQHLRRAPFDGRQMRQRLGEYTRRSFHPHQHGSNALVERWARLLQSDPGSRPSRRG